MNVESLVRKNILKLKPYTSARGDYLTGILLDANENSFGSVIDEFQGEELNRYPDPNHLKLRKEIGSYLNVDSKKLFIGVGSDEIIDLLIRIFCEPKTDNAVILEPTYGMYKVACEINDVAAIPVMLDESFQPVIKNVLGSVTRKTKLVFICSPNNPTGNVIDSKIISDLARSINGIIVIDEAYIEFSEKPSLINMVNDFSNIVVMRTFSKAWGMAGVRCGYCVASLGIINLLYKIKLPYNMNKLTSGMVLKAIINYRQKDKFVSAIIKERNYLMQSLNKIPGINKVYPSEGNFILFECGNATEIYQKLAREKIIIRDRSSQIKNCLRVSVGTREQNKIFLDELRNAL
ncbi:MAG: histidinol-phosphate transaminase [Ignavibacteriae bacterium HGW-Ignavibacteriae-3]|nr:MAG: histidinol-phosphate transaminase [Ignavibacteriae bacterium HGW-Ignavibacteriae-3]